MTLKFNYQRSRFFLETKGSVCTIEGDSACGKSYTLKALDSVLDMNSRDIHGRNTQLNDGNVIIVSAALPPRLIRASFHVENSLICVDNASYLFNRYRDLAKLVSQDYSNTYWLFGRGNFGVYIPPFGHYELVRQECHEEFEFRFKRIEV